MSWPRASGTWCKVLVHPAAPRPRLDSRICGVLVSYCNHTGKNSFLVLSFGLLSLLVSEDKGLIQAPLRDAARSRVHSFSC